jgi:hypothetical protein
MFLRSRTRPVRRTDNLPLSVILNISQPCRPPRPATGYLYFFENSKVKVEVTLRLTVSQSACLGIEPTVGLVTRCYFLSDGFSLKFAVLFLWGALSDERTGLQFAVQSLNGSSCVEPTTIL